MGIGPAEAKLLSELKGPIASLTLGQRPHERRLSLDAAIRASRAEQTAAEPPPPTAARPSFQRQPTMLVNLTAASNAAEPKAAEAY